MWIIKQLQQAPQVCCIISVLHCLPVWHGTSAQGQSWTQCPRPFPGSYTQLILTVGPEGTDQKSCWGGWKNEDQIGAQMKFLSCLCILPIAFCSIHFRRTEVESLIFIKGLKCTHVITPKTIVTSMLRNTFNPLLQMCLYIHIFNSDGNTFWSLMYLTICRVRSWSTEVSRGEARANWFALVCTGRSGMEAGKTS